LVKIHLRKPACFRQDAEIVDIRADEPGGIIVVQEKAGTRRFDNKERSSGD
jgi:hypothetical protein